MTKSTAILVCTILLSIGVYAMPVYDAGYQDWVIRVNHAAGWTMRIVDVLNVRGLKLHFIDCMYNRHDMGLNDCPLYYLRPM
jgi:hypothetical protein